MPPSATSPTKATRRTANERSFGETDAFLFNEGTHYRLYEVLGAHPCTRDGKAGIRFGVWAPNARAVSVVGDFNHWVPGEFPMEPVGSSGCWEAFLPGLERGTRYKYHIESNHRGYTVNKTDPFGFHHETPPDTASVVWPLDYEWNDEEWMKSRGERQALDSPISIYELHLGSWMRHPHDGGRPYSYRELAEVLPAYLNERGFTHVELIPVMEHPLYRSWGYQTTGYFAPTSRFGTPQDFMALVDALHAADIGVILDWVPSHFPSDEHGLGYFDGTHLFEHEDPRLGFHPDWKSCIFNYGRHEVRSFLISSALFWLDKFHIDGLRVDAVASMLYLDYSRREGEWIPNRHGGRENLEAIDFLQRLNTEVYRSFPDTQTYAEESTAWPGTTRPVYDGGLGFGFKWDMGWMHDTLEHFSRDPIHRRWHHSELTFRSMYMHSEHFVLPLSHDEVVHGKGSLYGKMAGDDWQKRANLRLLLTQQWTQPGKKLLFMGCEFGQHAEWNHDKELDWWLLENPGHAGIRHLMDRLNSLYRDEPALHEMDCAPDGFRWLEADDADGGILVYARLARDPQDAVIVAINTRPETREGVVAGVPVPGRWTELLNTDAEEFGGGKVGNPGGVESHPLPKHGYPHMIRFTVPPLGAVIFGAADNES